MSRRAKVWHEAEEGRVHELLLDYVHSVEQRQGEHFDRFQMLESMYDPNGPAANQADPRWRKDLGRITENVIASAVDTVCAAVATTEIRSRYMTDGADWEVQLRAQDLELYTEELAKVTERQQACWSGFFAGAKKGTGLNHVYADRDDEIHVDPTPIENIVVDDAECMNGVRPRQMHLRKIDVDRDILAQQYPDFEEEITKAQSRTGVTARQRWYRWTQPLHGTRNDVVTVESWILPRGKPDTDNYKPGRHVVCIDSCDLLDEEWDQPFFPFAVFRWGEREGSFYGISLAERIIGHQRTLNKRNWQRDRVLDLLAVPTTYVRQADASLRVQSTAIGNVVPIKGDYPVTVVPAVVGNEILQDRHDAKASAFEETGVSRMAAGGTPEPGLDSGVAIRERSHERTQRFATQEKRFEKFNLDTDWLIIDTCKRLGRSRAPVMSRRWRFGPRQLKWSQVDMRDVKVQIQASSTLNRTPSGRIQMVLEFAQAGVINQDEARRLLQHPDLEQALSLYTAALEAIEEDLMLIEHGELIVPEPFLNLEMAVWRGQNRYLLDRGRGAPEEILEAIRTYVVQAADILAKRKALSAQNSMPSMSGMLPPTDLAAPLPGAPPAPMAMPQQVPVAGAPSMMLPPQAA